MVDDALELVLVTAGFLVVLYGLGFLVVRHMAKANDIGPMFHLMRPILPAEPSAVRLRLDAALRDAEDGFNACSACGFENLKRSIFCSLCGSIVDAAASQSAHTEGKDKLFAQQQLASARDNHRRKARALKRKEWVRKLDVQGRMYWFRDASRVDGGGAQLQQGYVAQFAGDPLVEHATEVAKNNTNEQQLETEPLLTRDTDEQSGAASPAKGTVDRGAAQDAPQEHGAHPSVGVSVEEQTEEGEEEETAEEAHAKRPFVRRSLAETHELLESEVSIRSLTLIDSAAADPRRPSMNVHPDSAFSEDASTVLLNSKLDFPSKIAEFVARTSTAIMVGEQSVLKVNIRRDKLLSDSIEALGTMPADHARCPMRMAFVGEQGIDAGGVYREWLELVSQQLVAPVAGIFRCVDSQDRSFYLNPTSHQDIGDHHLAHIFATGRLLGRMLLEGNVTGFHLALPLLKIIVGQPVTLSDLEYFDAETYKSLLWLLENDGVDALGLDFTVTEQTAKGETIVAELIPNGSLVDVTDANKREYVERKLQYLLFGSVQSQLFAFLKGLYEVMPPELLMLFDAEELDYVMSGSDEIDVDDWERHTKSTIDLIEHPVLGWFWDLVREMPNEYRRRLLLYSTGSSRMPLAGFASLTSYDGRLCPFTLKGFDVDHEGGYIRSHACFNQLDLPRYYRKSDLKAVLYAVLDTDMYGFTST